MRGRGVDAESVGLIKLPPLVDPAGAFDIAASLKRGDLNGPITSIRDIGEVIANRLDGPIPGLENRSVMEVRIVVAAAISA